MALSIRNPKVEKLARELSAISGRGMTEAIGEALEARLENLVAGSDKRLALLSRIASACAASLDLDARSPDEILGYDAGGVFVGRR